MRDTRTVPRDRRAPWLADRRPRGAGQPAIRRNHLDRQTGGVPADRQMQVGCVIADAKHRVVATGYNGAPPGVDDSALDWSRPWKYEWVIHAEENALLHATVPDLSGATLYVTGPPCPECLKAVAAKGIKRVVWLNAPLHMATAEYHLAAKRVAFIAGIDLQQMEV